MSSTNEGDIVKSAIANVGHEVKENEENSETTSDSGIETSNTSSVAHVTFPASEILPPEPIANQVFEAGLVFDSNTIPLTPTSISPDIYEATDDLLNSDEISNHQNDTELAETLNFKTEDVFSLDENFDNIFDSSTKETSSPDSNTDILGLKHNRDVKESDNPVRELSLRQSSKTKSNTVLQSIETKSIDENTNNTDISKNKLPSSDRNLAKSSEEIKTANNTVLSDNAKVVQRDRNLAKSSDEIKTTNNTNISENDKLANSDRNLAKSTISLDEQNLSTTNLVISKSPYSRSAENISKIEDTNNGNLNSSTKELNKEKILNEFVNQKTKVAAVQKIIPETKMTPDQQNYDARYTRLPKELLPQDLGSLVKNVHGIFSSVSGSLKYAYNQTQRAPKPHAKNIVRPIPNGKVMDDIFEDDNEKLVTQNRIETSDKSPIPISIPSEVKKEDVINLDGHETEKDCKTDVYKLQVESLERVLAEQRKENAILRERVKQQVDELQERDQTFKELEVKVDSMSKRVEQADREKDAAVMRYASVECTAIEAKRCAEKAALAEKAAHHEMELMSNKLKSAHAEKQRICQLYDDKCHELSTSERELAKVREDFKELEGRLKWTQSKLRMEMDAYKEASDRAEKLSQQVSELEAAKETAITNATDSVRARQLEQDLKENQAALILLRHERDDLDRRLSSTTQQLETCKTERDTAGKRLTEATAEVERLKESNSRLEEENAELAALRAQAALADTLSAQLQRESERALQAEEALSAERARAETCAQRETAALQHAAALTANHVASRANIARERQKAQALEVENETLRERISTLEEEVTRLQTALSEESDKRNKETRTLARKVAEITEEVAEANKMLEWEKGENAVLKKKHGNAIKELNRELHRALKRCEQLEAKIPPPEATSDRTGSISSLSSGESAPPQSEENHLQNGHTDALPDIQVREPDRQALIERIVSLQRAAARRSERCEFLEEHAKQLTAELRGKSRLLRQLLSSLPAGAVASSHSDAHKKEIARLGGGAMAAVWGGEATGMTLELSLEMNNKLQAVLEDALLKNITLKENMDTLGEEIARLKAQMNNEKKT